MKIKRWSVFLVLLLSGCSVFDTGPKLAEDAFAMGKTLVLESVKTMDPVSGQANVHANVNDPTYIAEFLVGPVWLVRGKIGLVGGDIQIGLGATLAKDVEVTQDDIQLAYDILTQPDRSREEKSKRLFELTNRAIGWWEDFFSKSDPVE